MEGGVRQNGPSRGGFSIVMPVTFNFVPITHSMFKSKKKNDIFQLYAIIFCLMLKFMLNW